jgi:hypothetical protein
MTPVKTHGNSVINSCSLLDRWLVWFPQVLIEVREELLLTFRTHHPTGSRTYIPTKFRRHIPTKSLSTLTNDGSWQSQNTIGARRKMWGEDGNDARLIKLNRWY